MEDIIKELLLKEKENLNEIISQKTARLKDIERLLSSVKHTTKTNISRAEIDSTFPVDGSLLEQVIAVIKSKNRFLPNSEITKEMKLFHSGKDEDWLKRRISSVLSTGFREGDILHKHKFGKAVKDAVWGFKEWVNPDKTIKPPHNYMPK